MIVKLSGRTDVKGALLSMPRSIRRWKFDGIVDRIEIPAVRFCDDVLAPPFKEDPVDVD